MNAVLAGLEESGGFDARDCASYLGTSAGSIAATALACGVDPRARLGHLPEPPAVSRADAAAEPSGGSSALETIARLGRVAAAPLASLTLSSTAAGGAALRRLALARVPPGRRSLAQLGRMVDGVGARWDGRLRIVAVELESGRRVILGAPGAPECSVSEAVQASCAIPGVFRPVTLDGRSYVDGGVWSPTNMDAAEVARGGRVLCLNPTGSMRPTLSAPAAAIGAVSRSVCGGRGACAQAPRRESDHDQSRRGVGQGDGDEPVGSQAPSRRDQRRRRTGPAAGALEIARAVVGDAPAELDKPVLQRPRLDLAARPLFDCDRAPERGAEHDRGGARRGVLHDAEVGGEEARADPSLGLVLPRPHLQFAGGGCRERVDRAGVSSRQDSNSGDHSGRARIHARSPWTRVLTSPAEVWSTGWRSSHALPTIGCPANGSSAAGVKI